MLLVLSIIMMAPVYADSSIVPRGSAYFSAYGASLYKTSSTSFEVWYDVNANAALMDEIGVSLIEVYRSSDQENWTLMKTYEKEDYPEMTDTNTGSHMSFVTYDYATPGYYYTAYVVFYAKKGNGVGERDVYTYVLQM
jgi:hypothetical protein